MDISKRASTPSVVINQCSGPGYLALAFDDGPYQHTQTLVNTLNAAGAKATFFATVTLYGCIYDYATAVKNAYNSGHQISSHTWTHPSDFGSLTTAPGQITTEMQKLEQAMVNIIGKNRAYAPAVSRHRRNVTWLINWAKNNNLKLVTVVQCLGDSSGACQSSTFSQ